MMLDLGHNDITSLEPFRGLTKLRVLILAEASGVIQGDSLPEPSRLRRKRKNKHSAE